MNNNYMKIRKLLFYFLFCFITLKSAHSQQKEYVEYVQNGYGDIIGYRALNPNQDTVNFINNLNYCVKAYFKQIPQEIITYNIYLRTNPKTQIQDTILLPYPPANFLLDEKMIFLKQEKHVKIHSFEFEDFCNYLRTQYGCEKKY